MKKRTAAYGTIPRSQSELDLRQAAMTPPPPGKILDEIEISFYKAKVHSLSWAETMPFKFKGKKEN